MDATPAEIDGLAHVDGDASSDHAAGDTSDKTERPYSELGVWSGPDDPRRPKCWPRRKKWTATLILSAFAFLQPLSETMLAPVEGKVSRDLHITQAYEWLLVNSLILIGVGLAPLLLAPLSEAYGRKPVLVVGTAIFVVWNTASGASRTLGEMFAFRLLSGFGASVADALAGGVMSDLWDADERGRAFAFFMAAPLLGPALGPICAAFISEGIDWRWVFWIVSIASAVVLILAIIWLHETYEPRLEQRLRRKAKGASKESQENVEVAQTMTPFAEEMQIHLQRPFRMLGTQVIVQLLAGYMALLYGTMFLFLYMYPLMWTEQYHESVGIGSLNYLSFAIGLILGVNIAGHLNDYIYRRMKARNNGVGRPEFRVPAMIIGNLLVPIGLLWWGWSGQAKVHWIMPNIGSLLFAMGVYICSGCISVYTIDTYTQYAASAISTNLVLRSLTAAFFPLFAPYMFNSLGFGVGATVLACVFIVIGTTAIVILWLFGPALRARSPYCAAVGDS